MAKNNFRGGFGGMNQMQMMKQAQKMQQRSESAFSGLIAACERLIGIARSLRGIPNKELGRFTGQVNSLADKLQSWVTKK